MKISEALTDSKRLFRGTSELPQLIELFSNHAAARPTRWMEVGYGDGRTFLKIIESLARCRSISGIAIDPENDPPPEASRAPEFEYLKLALEDEAYRPVFDIINARHSLYYLRDLERGLQLLRSSLSEGGMLALTHWSEHCSLLRIHREITIEDSNRPSQSFEQLLRSAEDAGFSVLERRLVEGGLGFENDHVPPDLLNSVSQLAARGRPQRYASSRATARLVESIVTSASARRVNGIGLLQLSKPSGGPS